MITSADLLALARASVTTGSTPAALSRATSTAYYALFHALLEEARERLGTTTNPELARRFVAGFEHPDLLKAAKNVVAVKHKAVRANYGIGKPADWTRFFPESATDPDIREPAAELLDVCETFIKLQALRHAADYYADWVVSEADAQQYVADAERAVLAWRTLRGTDEALVFLFGARGLFQFRT